MNDTPAPITVFSDYICPFCYIGFLRLERLRSELELEVDWRFLEIHPDNPPEGRPLSELGYPPQHWQMLMTNLSRLAAEEGVSLPERTFTTNSRQALKLAQAALEHEPAVFESLNRALYEAYFLRGENIGDMQVLRALARSSGAGEALVERAWNDRHYDAVLDDNQARAVRMGIHGTPAWVFGGRVCSGVIPLEAMRSAVQVLPAGPS